MTPRTFQADTPLQALLVEQALLLARQLEQTAADAPDGWALAQVEAAAVPAGRELTRKAVEAALQAQAEAAEKKGRPAAAVTAAAAGPGTRLGPVRRAVHAAASALGAAAGLAAVRCGRPDAGRPHDPCP